MSDPKHTAIGRRRDELETPALILDLDVAQANIALMAEQMARTPVALRPAHEGAQESRARAHAGRRGCDRHHHRDRRGGARDGGGRPRRHPDRAPGRRPGQAARARGGRSHDPHHRRGGLDGEPRRDLGGRDGRRQHAGCDRRGRRGHEPLRRPLGRGGRRGGALRARPAGCRVAGRDGLRGALHERARPRAPHRHAGGGDDPPAGSGRRARGRRHRLRDRLGRRHRHLRPGRRHRACDRVPGRLVRRHGRLPRQPRRPLSGRR